MPNPDIFSTQANALIIGVESNSCLCFLAVWPDWAFPSACGSCWIKNWKSLKDRQVVKQLKWMWEKVDVSLSLLGGEANSGLPWGQEWPKLPTHLHPWKKGISPCSAGKNAPALPKARELQVLSLFQPHVHCIAQYHRQAALMYWPSSSHKPYSLWALSTGFEPLWGYQPKSSMLQLLWHLPVLVCKVHHSYMAQLSMGSHAWAKLWLT